MRTTISVFTGKVIAATTPRTAVSCHDLADIDSNEVFFTFQVGNSTSSGAPTFPGKGKVLRAAVAFSTSDLGDTAVEVLTPTYFYIRLSDLAGGAVTTSTSLTTKKARYLHVWFEHEPFNAEVLVTSMTVTEGINSQSAAASTSSGKDGRAASVSVGRVVSVDSTAPPRVVNTGSSSEAIFDFYIPRGAPGIDGAPGTSGSVIYPVTTVPAGSVGQLGDLAINTINGNLYEKNEPAVGWVLIGNIRGPQGNTGPAGPAGLCGPPGAAGRGVPDGGKSGQKIRHNGTTAVWADDLEVVTSDRTVFVNPSGSDLNDGLTVKTSVASIQKAVAIAASWLLSPDVTITIKLADGRYLLDRAVKLFPAGRAVLLGNTAVPENVVIESAVSMGQLLVSDDATSAWTLRGLSLRSRHGAVLVQANAGKVYLDCVDFGSTTASQVMAYHGGQVLYIGNCSVSGGALNHISVVGPGSLVSLENRKLTLTAEPTFASFCDVSAGGILIAASAKFEGNAIGRKFVVAKNGVIETSGEYPGFLPGTLDGASVYNGLYV